MKLIKGASASLAKPLSLIINQSLSTGIFPDKLKIAKVVPIYKKDDSTLIDNYRPISLLPVMSKIFEKVVYGQIYDYLISNLLLYKSQHGFQKLHSTETATLEFLDRIYNNLDAGETPISVFLDLSKAFDTLDHSILLKKLDYYGIRGIPLKWFQSYLSGRTQFVDYDGICSTALPITTGVPQGSILGPLLFLIYINDMHSAFNNFESILYADDTTLVKSLSSFSFSTESTDQNLSKNINSELQKVQEWLAANRLSLNISKTKYMIFHFPQRTVLLDLDLKINDTKIERVDEFNFLGLQV